MDFNQWWKELTRCPAQWTSEERMVAKGAWDYQQMRIDELEAEKAELEKQEPVAHIFPSTLEKFQSREMSDDAYSIAMVSPGEKTVPLYAKPLPPAVPDGYCIMPTALTAENGAKALMIGEFATQIELACIECYRHGNDDDCDICDGSGSFLQRVLIDWTTIKAIYTKAVEHFSAAPKEVE